ncbi:uncharacterized protein EDB93DRAFT_1104742 [Suillus bovinus]|uniref:uncharacterized protein n=1 Tax=Suillus bovinus TaxID=48563 RepID=UPI001B8600E1|nr:uncharacterized protein EDB93DRAFT_1104742 [Suillus bovinus]KAG2145280.1 hypothetical protein EDB93DRAFT_1104742 [Suillus bovinus]
MAFDMLHLTSGRLQNSDSTTLHSLYGSSVSGAEATSSFSIVTRDTSPDASRISAHSNNSSTKKLKRRHAKRGRFFRRKTATSLLEDASACDPLSLNALASLSSKWLDLSFLDRSPTYTDYFVNYWRHALAREQDIFVDHFTTVMAAVHEDLPAPSTISSTQSSSVQCDESSKCIPYEITCPWGNEEKCRLNGIKWDEWRREDDEIYIPTGKHHDYGAIGEPPIYPPRNMGTHSQIVAPKPIRAWNDISWLGHSPVAAAVYETSKTPSTFTTHHPHAESTDIHDSTSASPSSYLSALAASIPLPPRHVDDSHLTIHETQPICVERQQSRDRKLFQFLRMSYDQKVTKLERLVGRMRSHS